MTEHATTGAYVLPNDTDEARRQALIGRLCALQAHVNGEVFGYQYAADCFCLTNKDGSRSLDQGWAWSNEGKAVGFIERAVAEKIAKDRRVAVDHPHTLCHVVGER